jgi:hypothetical protein
VSDIFGATDFVAPDDSPSNQSHADRNANIGEVENRKIEGDLNEINHVTVGKTRFANESVNKISEDAAADDSRENQPNLVAHFVGAKNENQEGSGRKQRKKPGHAETDAETGGVIERQTPSQQVAKNRHYATRFKIFER